MERFAALSFLILFCLNSLFGQSSRVRNYSESADENPGNISRPSTQNSAAESEKEKPSSDVIKVETDLVIIPTRISDRNGKLVTGLKKEEFKIFEDGVEQDLAFFSDEDQPFTVALVLDMSYSSLFKLQDIQQAALLFINQLRPNDKVMVVSFDETVRILCEPTSNRRVLRLAIEATRIASGTSFYAALGTVLDKKLSVTSGRKAVVILSDGVDTTSDKSRAENILKSIGETDVMIFPIQYDTYQDVQKSRKQNAPVYYDENDRPYTVEMPKIKGEREEDYKAADQYLKEISSQSGGRVYKVNSSTNLYEAFAAIADELRKIYSLGYYPSGKTKIGGRYAVKVRVYRPNLIIRAKSSYLRKSAPNSNH